MSASGRVVSVNVSARKGVAKQPTAEIAIDDRGVVGDAHAGPWHRQVSLLGKENIDSTVIDRLRRIVPAEDSSNFCKDAQYSTDWILMIAQQVDMEQPDE